LKSWADIESSPEYASANDATKSAVRQKFLETTFETRPELTADERMMISSHVNRSAESSQQEGGGVGGFLGRTALGAGRTAGQILDVPFKPLHAVKEKVLEPALRQIPGMAEGFKYKTLDPKLGSQIMQERGMSPEGASIAMQYGGAPAEAYTTKIGPRRSEVLAEGAELALMGPYLEALGFVGRLWRPAMQAIGRGIEDTGVLIRASDDKISQAVAKVFPKPWDQTTNRLENVGRFFHSRRGLAAVAGVNVKAKWEKLVPDAAKRTQVRDLIEADVATLAKEAQTDPAKMQLFNQKMSTLDPGQQQALSWYIGRDEVRRDLAMKAGILRQWSESYVPHIMTEIQADKTGVLFQLNRTLKLSLKELEALGNKAFIGDIAVADSVHEVAFQNMLNKNTFTKFVRMLRTGFKDTIPIQELANLQSGYPSMAKSYKQGKLPVLISQGEYEKTLAASPKLAAEYVFANPTQTRVGAVIPRYAIREAEAIGPGKELIEGKSFGTPVNLYIHRSFYNQVRRLLPPASTSTPLGETFKQFVGGARSLIMFNPLFHGVNVGSGVIASAPWGDATKALNFWGEGGQIKGAWKLGDDDAAKLIADAVRSGYRGPGISNEWYNWARDNIGKAAAAKDPNWAQKAMQYNDRMLFDTIVTNGGLGLWKHVAEKWTPLIGEFNARKVAAEFVNTTLGTMPTESFSPWMQKYGQWILFSRSWTMSNFRALAHAGGIRWGVKHLSPEAFAALGEEQQMMITKSMAYYGIQNEMMNRVIAGHSSAENPPGHELDIDTGKTDKRGRRIFVAGSPFLFVRQMMKLGGHVAEGDIDAVKGDLYGKLGIWKGMMEAAQNRDYFSQQQIYMPGAPAGEKLARGLGHAAAAATPFGATMRDAMRPGQDLGDTVRTEILDPMSWTRLLTYWESHGLSYHTEVFTRLKKADRWMILQNISPEARGDIIKGVALGRIEGAGATELKKMKDKLDYIRSTAREEARMAVMNGDIQKAATILVNHGWSSKGARTFIATRGRQMGTLLGESEE
jgi:hypothetical protein